MPPVALIILLLAVPEPVVQQAKTAHYELTTENFDADDTGAMLEALYARLHDWFGKEPAEKSLKVRVSSTAERWTAAMKADGLNSPAGAGGFYSPMTKTAYLFLQPSQSFTRQLILHEATHQFHFLASTGNTNPQAAWYTEGLAEYFGMHTWDGKELKTGIVPRVTLEDYPAQALKQLDGLKGDWIGVGSAAAPSDRPLDWALIHFLSNNYPDEMRDLGARLDRGDRPDVAWTLAFGDFTKSRQAGFRAWIASHEQPWKIVWDNFQDRGDFLEGASATTAIAILKVRPAALEAGMEIVDGKGMGGLIFGFKSADLFCELQVDAAGKGRVVKREDGRWKILANKDCPAQNGGNVLSVETTGETVAVRVNSVLLGTFSAAGDLGLHVQAGRAKFRVTKP